MPSTSERQRKAAGMALNAKRKGVKLKGGGPAAKMEKMSASQLREFAKKGKKK